MAFQWTDRLEVGHDLIDRQHLELLRRFNDLSEACRQHRGKEEVVRLFEFLDSYVYEHFREEEQLMRRNDYPAVAAHEQEHRRFIGDLQGLKRAMEARGATTEVVIETCHALLGWVVNHIHRVDAKLGAWLRDRRAA